MRRIVLAVAGILALAAGAFLLAGCESPAAQREWARADRIRAEAEAYEQRQQADTQAAAERANIRQMERDAAHQRSMELIPYVLIIVGGLLLAGLGGLLFWDWRRQPAPAAADPRLLALLEQLQLHQAERDREIWRAMAILQRRSLPAGSVAIYDSEGRRVR